MTVVSGGLGGKTFEVLSFRLDLIVALPDAAGTLPAACNAGLIDSDEVIEDFTRIEIQSS
jgi:hypothetical protein